MYSKKVVEKIPDEVLEKIISDLKKLRLLVVKKNIGINKDQMTINDFIIGGCDESQNI